MASIQGVKYLLARVWLAVVFGTIVVGMIWSSWPMLGWWTLVVVAVPLLTWAAVHAVVFHEPF